MLSQNSTSQAWTYLYLALTFCHHCPTQSELQFDSSTFTSLHHPIVQEFSGLKTFKFITRILMEKEVWKLHCDLHFNSLQKLHKSCLNMNRHKQLFQRILEASFQNRIRGQGCMQINIPAGNSNNPSRVTTAAAGFRREMMLSEYSWALTC